jgi:hypothetical protein
MNFCLLTPYTENIFNFIGSNMHFIYNSIAFVLEPLDYYLNQSFPLVNV